MEPSVVPVEVLESWGNYKKHGFNLGRTLAYIFLIVLILLPLMFFRPSIIAERTDVKSASDAIYNIHIKTLLPLHSVSATINGTPVRLQEEGSKEFKAAISDNGTLKIKAVSFNGQVAARFYKVPAERVIVVSDEMALPPGSVRIRQSGSAGGHNGLKSVIAHLGTDRFPRIRLGIGEPEHEPVDWVLGHFTGHDAEAMSAACENAAKAAVCYICEGPDKAMSKYNVRAKN